MSEPNTISLILDSLTVVARGVINIQWSWHFSWLLRLLALPWKIILIPLSLFAKIFLIVFAPALYILSYLLSWFRAFLAFIISLEPLYTFFGAAAAVGIVAGILLGVFSSVITTYLGMHDDYDEDDMDYIDTRSLSSKRRYLDDVDMHGMLPESSSTEPDRQYLDTSLHRRRPTSSLLSQTIHEEDDSE